MAQYAYPTSDVDNSGAWTSAPLYAKIDEEPYDDADYVTSPKTASSKSFTVGLGGTITDPASSTGHIFRVRARSSGSGTMQVELLEGSTVRATLSTFSLTTSFAEYSYALTGTEADSITDYTALRIRVTAVTTGTNKYQYASWARFEVPDLAATQKSVADSGSGSDTLAAVKAKLALSDGGAGTDGLSGLKAGLAIAESGSGADSLALRAALAAIADAGGGTDTVSAQSFERKSIFDAGAGAEVLGILARIVAADAGAGTDLAALRKKLGAVLDSGNGAESVLIRRPANIGDFGAGADVITGLNATIAVFETGSGAEGLAILARFTAADQGGGTDEIVVGQASSGVHVSDAGAGSDQLGPVRTLAGVAEAGTGAELVVVFRGSSPKLVGDSGRGADFVFVDPQGRPYFAFIFDADRRERILGTKPRGFIRDADPRERIVEKTRRP